MDPVFAPVRGFNASYGHLRILCGSLRPPTYFGQTKGALNVLRRNTALRQNEESRERLAPKGAGRDLIYRGAFFVRSHPLPL